jgi:double-stranded uracil-DNA glycosylase
LGFTREELEGYRDAVVPDLCGDQPPRLVFVGINPGLWTAATGTHFAHPSNRFYPALHRAGITERELDRVRGLSRADRRELIDRGIAITNVVRRATARASELSTAEVRDGADDLVRRLAEWQPRVVALAGVTTYRTAFRRPAAVPGRQSERIGDAELWVVPNPSGLNAHETIDSLAARYREVAVAAGVVGDEAPGGGAPGDSAPGDVPLAPTGLTDP